MAIIIFASMVLNGVIAEKSSRVVEVLLASIRPRHLLAGKVLGIGLLGLGQMAVLVAVGLGSAFATGVVEIPTTTIGALGSVLLWFVLGYAFYAVVYAAAGALVSGLEDAQNVATPVGLFTGLMYAFSTIAVNVADDVLVVRVITLLPPVAPFALPGRASLGNLEAWEVAVAVVLMLAAIYAMIRLAGRLYAGSILQTGARVRVRDAWRSREL